MENERYEPPTELTKKNVVYWSNTFKRLVQLQKDGKVTTGGIRSKAKKFLANDCIEYDPERKSYVCKPIEGYNKTTYVMSSANNNEFECTCQFFQGTCKNHEENLICSHILALKMFLKIKNWEHYRPTIMMEEAH